MQGEEGRTHVQTIKGLASYTTFVLGWTENVCCQPPSASVPGGGKQPVQLAKRRHTTLLNSLCNRYADRQARVVAVGWCLCDLYVLSTALLLRAQKSWRT